MQETAQRDCPVRTQPHQAALRSVSSLRADTTTDATTRRGAELLKGNRKSSRTFSPSWRNVPGEVSPEDVNCWPQRLEERLRPATVYVRISLLPSFYE
jgi:hypothetical protein